MGLHGDALTGLTHAAPPATSAPAFYNITLIIRSQGGAACLIAYVAFSLPAMHAWRYNLLHACMHGGTIHSLSPQSVRSTNRSTERLSSCPLACPLNHNPPRDLLPWWSSGLIRFANATLNQARGYLEVNVNGRWGAVCGAGPYYWSYTDATVACRQLGLPYSGAIPFYGSSNITSAILPSGSFFAMSWVQCLGNETRLTDCSFFVGVSRGATCASQNAGGPRSPCCTQTYTHKQRYPVLMSWPFLFHWTMQVSAVPLHRHLLHRRHLVLLRPLRSQVRVLLSVAGELVWGTCVCVSDRHLTALWDHTAT